MSSLRINASLSFCCLYYGEESIFPENLSLVKVNDLIQINVSNSENSFIQDLFRRLTNSPFFIILFLLVALTFVLNLIISLLIKKKLNNKFLKNFENNIDGNYYSNFNIINYNDFPKYDFRLTEE